MTYFSWPPIICHFSGYLESSFFITKKPNQLCTSVFAFVWNYLRCIFWELYCIHLDRCFPESWYLVAPSQRSDIIILRTSSKPSVLQALVAYSKLTNLMASGSTAPRAIWVCVDSAKAWLTKKSSPKTGYAWPRKGTWETFSNTTVTAPAHAFLLSCPGAMFGAQHWLCSVRLGFSWSASESMGALTPLVHICPGPAYRVPQTMLCPVMQRKSCQAPRLVAYNPLALI